MAKLVKELAMELNSLTQLPRGTPLSAVVQQPAAEAFLSPSVYKIGNGIYLCISPFRLGSLEKDPSGPFVTGVVLAADDGAARRALLMDIESDNGETMSIPVGFFPAAVMTPAYGAILQALKREKPQICQETAEYRIASDGRFVHRMIETEHFSFFFRKPDHDDSEPPYVVIRKLN